MEGATNFFETSKSETRAISASIERLATQVSKMEEKLLEEQREEEVPRTTEPPRDDDGVRIQSAAKTGSSAAVYGGGAVYRPSVPLFGPPLAQGWCRGESSRAQFNHKESLCASVSIDDGVKRPIAMKDVDAKAYWEENFVDKDGEEITQEAEDTLRLKMRENTRAYHEKTLNNMPCVISAKVTLKEDTGTMDEGVDMHYEIDFNEEFARVRDIMLQDGNYSDIHILWYVEGIAKFVEDLGKGTRDINEISNLESFEQCLDVIYGERKENEENPSKEALEEEDIVALMEKVEDTTIKEEEKPDTRPGEKISLIMVKLPRKKRNKKKSSNIA